VTFEETIKAALRDVLREELPRASSQYQGLTLAPEGCNNCVIRHERQAVNQRRNAGGPGNFRIQGNPSAHGKGGAQAAREPDRARLAGLARRAGRGCEGGR
jgi:hypothetical protein